MNDLIKGTTTDECYQFAIEQIKNGHWHLIDDELYLNGSKTPYPKRKQGTCRFKTRVGRVDLSINKLKNKIGLNPIKESVSVNWLEKKCICCEKHYRVKSNAERILDVCSKCYNRDRLRWQVIYRDHFTCQSCDCKVEVKKEKKHDLNYANRDHIYAIARGGADTLENSRLLCRECNAIKTGKFVGHEKMNLKVYRALLNYIQTSYPLNSREQVDRLLDFGYQLRRGYEERKNFDPSFLTTPFFRYQFYDNCAALLSFQNQYGIHYLKTIFEIVQMTNSRDVYLALNRNETKRPRVFDMYSQKDLYEDHERWIFDFTPVETVFKQIYFDRLSLTYTFNVNPYDL